MSGPVPKEIRELAEQAAKDELADSDDRYTRQCARQVGAIVAQVVWAALKERGYL